MITYIYFRENKKCVGHGGVICVGYSYNETTQEIEYAVSLCSPKDRFSRPSARRRIDDRFENGYTSRIASKSSGYPKYKDIVRWVSEDYNSKMDAFGPKFAEKLGMEFRPYCWALNRRIPTAEVV